MVLEPHPHAWINEMEESSGEGAVVGVAGPSLLSIPVAYLPRGRHHWLTFAPAVPLALQILELNQCLFFIRSPSLGYSLIVTESILRQSPEPQIPRPRSFYVFLTS